MPRTGQRRFATVLFTDIVGSTDIAAELGDRRWRDLIRRHHAIVRAELKRFEGREIDTAGDGFFATFDSPGAAIRCACAISDSVREVGLEIRAGLHGGEVELEGGKAGGIAVNTAARVMAVGGPGKVLVSSSLHDVVAGSSLGSRTTACTS
ncbi:MAG: adenylate/guanylate cyclase domain-containing protein [Actinomycetota bacterium]